MQMSEDHKQKLAEGRERYQARRRKEKEEKKLQAEADKPKNGDAFATSRVIRREKPAAIHNVVDMPLDISSDGLLDKAEKTLEAAKKLVSVGMELIAESKKRTTEQERKLEV